MDWFASINRFYNTFVQGERLWSLDQVKQAVKLNVITESQFAEITDQEYVA
ncbi:MULTISPECIES: XkdX family protein [Pontibacillus]|uniref:XkdX family protein n=1 Tax=Pontibacillus chungwhensis TaxID=265426 RepID=A0ABY8UZI1_9BACI|nr:MULTISPECIES: XkdX family protein [Pontibacillus]MCD5324791.1 XkdX family protein [Pontibacillus sp. HN14]WIF98750.1 XkdX family protein [Pontibacillus chungwhensis]